MSLFCEWNILSTNNKNLFSKRWGHSTIFYKDKVYFFGGFNGNSADSLNLNNNKLAPFLNDFFSLDLTSLTFEKISAKGDYPSPRSNHTAIMSNSHEHNPSPCIIIHGGSDNLTQFADTHFYDLNSNQWTTLEDNKSEFIKSLKPPPRTYHTANIINNYMIIFGGESFDQYISDLFALDIINKIWHKIVDECDSYLKLILNPRLFHSTAVIGTKLFIYGGYSSDFKCQKNNNFVVLDFINFSPRKKESIGGSTINFENNKDMAWPYPRWGASLNVGGCNKNNLFLFGGRNKIDFNDFWCFDTNTKNWENIISDYTRERNFIPVPRRKHSSIIINENIIFLSGGFNGMYLDDIYLVNLNDMCRYKTKYDEYKKFLTLCLPENISTTSIEYDFTINFKNQIFYCIKNLFFRRIPQDDIINSHSHSPQISIMKLFKGKIKNLDLEKININLKNPKNVFLFLELLYFGKFTKYNTVEEYRDVYYLCKGLGLKNLTLKVANVLITYVKVFYSEYNYINQISSFLNNFDFNNLFLFEKLWNLIEKDDLIYVSVDKEILPVVNTHLDQTKFINKAFEYFIKEKKYLKNKLKNKEINSPPKKILNDIQKYFQTEKLPIIDEDEINDLIELLFYSDFLILESLFNVSILKNKYLF